MQDPFLNKNTTFLRLLEEYRKYNSLVVAVDFDNTIYDFHKKGYTFPAVIDLLKECNKVGFKVVIFTASPKERFDEIRQYCKDIGVFIDGINEEVIDSMKGGDRTNRKIYYNVLLDDRAGLGEAYEVLYNMINLKVTR